MSTRILAATAGLLLAFAASAAAFDLDPTVMRLITPSIEPDGGASYLGILDGRHQYAQGDPSTSVAVRSAVEVLPAAGVAVRFRWTGQYETDQSVGFSTSVIVPIDQAGAADVYQVVTGHGVLQLAPAGDWVAQLVVISLIDQDGNEGVLSVSDDVYLLSIIPSTPPTALSLTASSSPVAIGDPIPAAQLPWVTITDATPSTYDVAWTFSTLVTTTLDAGSTHSVLTTGLAPTMVNGEMRLVFPAALSLTPMEIGAMDISAIVHEGSAATAAVSGSMIVHDPYSDSSVVGRGTINVATTSKAKPTATFDFAVHYRRGVTTGRLKFISKSQDFSFDASSFSYLTVKGPQADCAGLGVVGKSSGYSFLLHAIDGSDQFRLQVWSPAGALVYDTGNAVPIGKNDDIVITYVPGAAN